MAYALPVIVGDADGTQDDLVRDGNGWIITPGDADELRAVIEDSLSDATRLRAMGREGYRIVSEELNLENMVDELVHAVRSVRRKD